MECKRVKSSCIIISKQKITQIGKPKNNREDVFLRVTQDVWGLGVSLLII